MLKQKIFLWFLVPALLIGGGFLVREAFNREVITFSSGDRMLGALGSNTSYNTYLVADDDEDGDGLKTWEEILLGTDASFADSDGDGVDDGIEVRVGRNPLGSGLLKDRLKSESAQTNKLPYNGNITETTAAALFSEYLNLRGAEGDTLSPEREEALVQGLLQRLPQERSARVYTRKDVRVVATSPEAIRNYGNGLGAVIITHSPPGTQNEIAIVVRAIEADNLSLLNQLDPIIRGYRGILNDARNLSVPESALKAHLEFLNSASLVLESIETFRSLYTDPVKGLVRFSNYTQDILGLAEAMRSLQDYFNTQGIRFQQNTHGAIFMQSI